MFYAHSYDIKKTDAPAGGGIAPGHVTNYAQNENAEVRVTTVRVCERTSCALLYCSPTLLQPTGKQLLKYQEVKGGHVPYLLQANEMYYACRKFINHMPAFIGNISFADAWHTSLFTCRDQRLRRIAGMEHGPAAGVHG